MSTITSSQSQASVTNKPVAQIEADRAKLQQMLQCYPADRQVKYLHLQAEIDVLIQQLQSLKRQAAK
jgi:hypothetical protein